MGVTFWRWSAAVALGCAAVALTVLPLPPTLPQSWTSAAPPPLAEGIAKLVVAAGRAHDAVRDYRAVQALDRWSAAGAGTDTSIVRVDRGVPSSVAAQVRRIVLEQWATLATPVSAANAEVFVYFDSTSLPRADTGAALRRLLEPRRLVDVAFALPQATGGRQCVALVRLRGVSAAHIAALRTQPLIGVCGFYAAFGEPGDAIDSWLASTNYRFARRSDWSVARAPATDASSLYALPQSAARCLTGKPPECRAALQIESSPARESRTDHRLAWLLDGAPTNAAGPRATRASLGDAEDELLADAVRSLGTERFARFWRSTGRPDSAFVAASGIAIDRWTQQWLATTYGSPPTRPAVRLRDVVWLTITAAIAVVLAARPRHRVLA